MHDATPALMGLLGWGLGWGVGCLVTWWLGAPPACTCPLGKGLVVLASGLLTAGSVGP
jgi:hypothetical protein